ncbi:MAG: spermidine/putrescine ABC transporter, partial [Bacteroidales bacterium]|nr:spermidine/putrescine ABC transporter [Bacteroidales bacterium]
MRKSIKVIALAAALFLSLSLSAKDRNTILKVYNWSDYIAEGVVEDFENWYFEQTGEKIEVIYMTFDVNESMLSKIENGHEDYDVVCPSDYIIERMLNNGLILPLDFSALGATPNYIEQCRS